jgi:hypothetical protein
MHLLMCFENHARSCHFDSRTRQHHQQDVAIPLSATQPQSTLFKLSRDDMIIAPPNVVAVDVTSDSHVESDSASSSDSRESVSPPAAHSSVNPYTVGRGGVNVALQSSSESLPSTSKSTSSSRRQRLQHRRGDGNTNSHRRGHPHHPHHHHQNNIRYTDHDGALNKQRHLHGNVVHVYEDESDSHREHVGRGRSDVYEDDDFEADNGATTTGDVGGQRSYINDHGEQITHVSTSSVTHTAAVEVAAVSVNHRTITEDDDDDDKDVTTDLRSFQVVSSSDSTAPRSTSVPRSTPSSQQSLIHQSSVQKNSHSTRLRKTVSSRRARKRAAQNALSKAAELRAAAAAGDVEGVRHMCLIPGEVDLNGLDPNSGRSALMLAVAKGHVEVRA